MNAIHVPRPLSQDESTVTLGRAAWDALVQQIEDAEDLAHVAAAAARRAAIGDEAYMRECITDAELSRFLEGETLVTIHRKRAGLSQPALAAAAGIDPENLNGIEDGRTPGSADEMRKLATVLGVSVKALVE